MPPACRALFLAFAVSAAAVFAQTAWADDLANVCPNPLVVQFDWLPASEHGPLFHLIGVDGEVSEGRYEGEIDDTGLTLTLLTGGEGLGLGHGESAYFSLHAGNSKAGLTPHLAMVGTDNAFIFSRKFPTLQVLALLERSPSALFWDPESYPEGFQSIDDLIAFADSNRGKIYVSTVDRTYGKYLVDQGVPRNVFMEGYRGDLENFVVQGGVWLNQGFVTNEVYALEHGRNWNKPLDFLLVSDFGYDLYTSALSIAAHRKQELAPCLERFIPRVQQAMLQYYAAPEEIAQFLETANEGALSPAWWRTPVELSLAAARTAREEGLVGNGPNTIVGDFHYPRIDQLLDYLRSHLDERALPRVASVDVATNRFIDAALGFDAPTKTDDAALPQNVFYEGPLEPINTPRGDMQRLVLGFADAWANCRPAAMNNVFSEDVVFAYPGKKHIGRAAALADLDAFCDVAEATSFYFPEDAFYIDVEAGRIAAEVQFRSTVAGEKQVVNDVWIATVIDGKIAVLKEYLDGRVKILQAEGRLNYDEGAAFLTPWPSQVEATGAIE